MTLKEYGIPVNEWQVLAQDRNAWSAVLRMGSQQFEEGKQHDLDVERLARKKTVLDPSIAVPCGCAERSGHLSSGFKLT